MDKRPQTEKRKLRNRERTEAKAEYKELASRTRSVDRDTDLANKLKIVKSNLKRGDELYTKVRKHLGGSAADARFIKETVELASRTSKLLNINTKPFDLKRIIKSLRRQCREDLNFNRHIANEYSNLVLRVPPTFRFFYGAIKTESLVIKKRKQRVVERLVETQAVTATERNVDTNMQDTTPKEVEHIYKEIKKIAKDDKSVPFFRTLVDPKSFSQTVENIFHASFLVKEGQLGLKSDRNKNIVLTLEDKGQDSKSGCQSIFSFSMEDYKKWISQYDIKTRSFNPRQ